VIHARLPATNVAMRSWAVPAAMARNPLATSDGPARDDTRFPCSQRRALPPGAHALRCVRMGISAWTPRRLVWCKPLRGRAASFDLTTWGETWRAGASSTCEFAVRIATGQAGAASASIIVRTCDFWPPRSGRAYGATHHRFAR
jgi:hypothetical protein